MSAGVLLVSVVAVCAVLCGAAAAPARGKDDRDLFHYSTPFAYLSLPPSFSLSSLALVSQITVLVAVQFRRTRSWTAPSF